MNINTVVQEPDMPEGVVLFVMGSIQVVLVQIFIVGRVVLVCIHIHILVRAGMAHPVPV